MSTEPFRYEYRIFARELGSIETRMRQLGSEPAIRESREIYLVGAKALDQNVKIRFDKLDIKELVTERDGFEQWRPVAKWSFPLDPTALQDLQNRLQHGQRLDGGAGRSPEDLTAALRQGERSVVAVDLFKRRYGLEINDCAAEFADVEINGASLRSACVESTDLDATRQLAFKLGLADYPNVSYVRAIAQVTGLVG